MWPFLDADGAVRVVVVRGEGSNFSSGGDFDMIGRMIEDEARTLIRVWKEAGDLVYNLVSAPNPWCPRSAATPWARASPSRYWPMYRSRRTMRAFSTASDPAWRVAAGDHAVIIWPLALRDWRGQARYHLLTNKPLSGAEAERIGLIAMAVPDHRFSTTPIRSGAHFGCEKRCTAVRCWTKHAAQ